jgi:hypothetical protein
MGYFDPQRQREIAAEGWDRTVATKNTKTHQKKSDRIPL